MAAVMYFESLRLMAKFRYVVAFSYFWKERVCSGLNTAAAFFGPIEANRSHAPFFMSSWVAFLISVSASSNCREVSSCAMACALGLDSSQNRPL